MNCEWDCIFFGRIKVVLVVIQQKRKKKKEKKKILGQIFTSSVFTHKNVLVWYIRN